MSNNMLLAIVAVAVVFAIIFNIKNRKNFEYKCPKCGHRFQKTLSQQIFTIFFYGFELSKCPECNKWSFIHMRKKNS